MDDKVKHQHYVPVMYLKRFVGSDGQLYAFDINKRSGVRNLPRAFAQKKFFYDLSFSEMRILLEDIFPFVDPAQLDDLAHTQVVEKTLMRIERDADIGAIFDGTRSPAKKPLDAQITGANSKKGVNSPNKEMSRPPKDKAR